MTSGEILPYFSVWQLSEWQKLATLENNLKNKDKSKKDDAPRNKDESKIKKVCSPFVVNTFIPQK